MTLAIASFSPMPSLGLRSDSIVLLADTRYSDDATTWTADDGKKICQLGPRSGCIFAGRVASAKIAIARLSTAITSAGDGPTPDTDEELAAILSAAAEEAAGANRPLDYELAIGFIDRHGRPQITTWGDHANLEVTEWGAAMGALDHLDQYQDELVRVVDVEMARGSIPFTADHWLLCHALALHKVFLRAGVDPRVGGGVQCAIIHGQSGYREGRIAIAPSGFPDGSNTRWSELTRQVSW